MLIKNKGKNSGEVNKSLIVVVALVLIGVGIVGPKLDIFNNETVIVNNGVELIKPSDPELLKHCEEVTKALRNGSGDRTTDAKRLSNLYTDLSTLYGLDETIKTTEEVRNANSLAGAMLRMNIGGLYPNLTKACTDLVASQIGTKRIPLDGEIRKKTINAFKALAWACNEGSK